MGKPEKETHWKKVAKEFMPTDTPEQKIAVARLHRLAFAGSSRG